MEAIVYNQKGVEDGKIKLPKSIFGLPKNDALVHQVVVSMMGNARTPVAHTKNRGEVSGTGKKPWKQKGTGRARHGSRRSPIWVGGGIAHGPRNERDYSRKINKKMKTKALFTVLSQKYEDGKVLFVGPMDFKAPKTSEAKKMVGTLATISGFSGLNSRKNAFILATPNKSEALSKSFRNFGNIETAAVKDLNPVDVLKYKYVLFGDANGALEVLKQRSYKKEE